MYEIWNLNMCICSMYKKDKNIHTVATGEQVLKFIT
jgi:hypothetical protein